MDHSHDAAATAANQLFNHSEFPAPSRLRRGTSQQDLIGPWEFVPATEAESEQHELDTKQIAKQIADCRLQIVIMEQKSRTYSDKWQRLFLFVSSPGGSQTSRGHQT